MEQKFTNKLFFGTILVFLVLFGCQQDDFGNKGSLAQQDNSQISVKRIPFSKVKKNPKAMEQLKGLIPKEITKEGIAYRVVYSEDYRISIDTANVMYIEKVGGGHSYSLEAIDEEGHYGKEGELKNLVLNFESNDNSYSKYVLSYNLTDEELYKWKNNEGGINLPERTTFFRIGGNPSGFVLNKPDCWESVMVAQDFPCASGQHMPGDPDCVYIGTVFAAFQTMTIEVISVGCGDGGGSGGGGGGSGNGEGNDGNGNDNGGDGPGFADQDGDPIITTPIKGTGTLDTGDSNDCDSLKELLEPEKQNVNDYIDSLTDKYEEGYENEISYSFEKKKVFDPQIDDYIWEYDALELEGTPNSVNVVTGELFYAAIHLHPKESGITGGIFSWQDLRALEDLYEGAYFPHKQDVTLMVLAPDPENPDNYNIYALKVDNFNTLTTKLNNDWNNPKMNGLSEKEKIEEIHDKLGNAYKKNKNNLEKYFLQRFGSYGISLYKLNENDDWDKLELENTANGLDVDPKPCN